MDDLISRREAIDALMEKDKKLRNINWYDNPYAEGECGGIDEALSIISNLTSAQPEQKWIPCKTGILPEERDKFYQATYLLDNGDRIVDYVYFNSKGMWSNYAYEYSELLAWMPLPEAYKEDN